VFSGDESQNHRSMSNRILGELRNHAPFTIFGASTGLVVMALSQGLPPGVSNSVFYTLHPIHVVLSALVTASVYELHTCKYRKGNCNLWLLLLIGYVGSIGIATVSDSLIPYFGETLLNMPNRRVHIGFIEKWWLINPLAFIGAAVAYFSPKTKLPHAGHVLLSTWASLFHILMAKGESAGLFSCAAVFFFLFLAVWIPCCMSDIVFPLLFVGHRDENREHNTHQ